MRGLTVVGCSMRMPTRTGPTSGFGLVHRPQLRANVEAQGSRAATAPPLLRAFDDCEIPVRPSIPADAPRGLSSTGDTSFNSPWTLVGFPALTIPFGLDADGLPLGIQLVARPGANLLDAAARCVPVLGASPPPPWSSRA